MLVYWLKNQGSGNFGDMLVLLLARLFESDLEQSENLYFLIGSCLSDTWFDWAISQQAPNAYFWGCGWRGESVTSARHPKIHLCGVRGPQSALALGMSAAEAIGDPGYLLPLLVPPSPRAARGKIILVPHFLEPDINDLYCRRKEIGVDEIILPAVRDVEDTEKLIHMIASADFVLCGAMHAAIIAHAYDVPFCFFDSGRIDCPPKWQDLAAAINVEALFAKNYAQGREWWEKFRGQMRKPDLHAILSAAPAKLKDAYKI